MSQLAIKGHPIRGKEVIQLLEMLGGKNIHNYVGTSNECYAIDDNKICTIYTSVAKIDNCVIFTLEEFEKLYPYKVGDKVITKDKFIGTITDIRWQGDSFFVGKEEGDIVYTVQVSTTRQITYLKEDLQPYKEEGVNLQELERKLDEALEKETTESLNKWLDGEPEPEPKAPILSNRYDYAEGKCGYVIPDGYEFDYIKEGFQTEIILKPKKPTYPKDYKECCKILNIPFDENIVYAGHWVYGGKYLEKHLDVLRKFQQLLICREAYWKIAGEEMGLDRHWEPNWGNDDETKFCIYTTQNMISLDIFGVDNRILAFPTEEMRDTFFENFKDLINDCKELL